MFTFHLLERPKSLQLLQWSVRLETAEEQTRPLLREMWLKERRKNYKRQQTITLLNVP
jgi:hypothetical protein